MVTPFGRKSCRIAVAAAQGGTFGGPGAVKFWNRKKLREYRCKQRRFTLFVCELRCKQREFKQAYLPAAHGGHIYVQADSTLLNRCVASSNGSAKAAGRQLIKKD